MNKIVLAAAAVLALSSAAFAGSDNYGSNSANQPAAAVDTSSTASIHKSSQADVEKPATTQGVNRDLWGNN
ncbi:DUF680 domain-containing protein [Mesorhizobium sp.]|uniref:DUF680 domain-containing protein n=1 Tax=Mesorhizobium sp. TaxID=1871066 RepID=UPI0025DAB771|nr:DUF680 domain-containing protein [Mesorhizobium sp.]